MKFVPIIAFVAFIFLGCSPAKPISRGKAVLPASELQPFGRTDLVNGQLELIGSASSFAFSFDGKSCDVYVSVPGTAHAYLQYEMDGVYQKRIRVAGAEQPVRIEAEKEGGHRVRIYKATEATTGAVFISKISGANLHALANPDLPLIEFIGNSITCGAAADASEVPCGAGEYLDQHNAYYAYGPRVARGVGANFLLSSVSGIGIYRTWNRQWPSMPLVYDRTDLQADSKRQWDFSRYTPKIVSIALGTNDLSNGDGQTERPAFDSARFVNAYVQFVAFVQSKYPSAQIVLLNSPMVHGDRDQLLRNCLAAVKEQTDKTHPHRPLLLKFIAPMEGHGCGGHPSVEDHAVIAEQLIPFFSELLRAPDVSAH